MGHGVESPKVSPVRQGAPTVSVPYLIRPKLDGNTVSTNCGSWDGDYVRTREVMAYLVRAFPNQSVDLVSF